MGVGRLMIMSRPPCLRIAMGYLQFPPTQALFRRSFLRTASWRLSVDAPSRRSLSRADRRPGLRHDAGLSECMGKCRG